MGQLSFNVAARSAMLACLALLSCLTLLPCLILFAPVSLAAANREPSVATTKTATATRGVARTGDQAAPWSAVQIVISKSKKTMAVYRSGNFEKEFPVVLGLVPEGRKRYANDARTPEGLYHIIGKRRHERWQYFLAIDYPNAEDRRAYGDEVRRGKIPDENGSPFAIGGSVGIHGNDREDQQAAGVNWTKGCVALKAADIAEVAGMVPIGTPVWIVE